MCKSYLSSEIRIKQFAHVLLPLGDVLILCISYLHVLWNGVPYHRAIFGIRAADFGRGVSCSLRWPHELGLDVGCPLGASGAPSGHRRSRPLEHRRGHIFDSRYVDWSRKIDHRGCFRRPGRVPASPLQLLDQVDALILVSSLVIL